MRRTDEVTKIATTEPWEPTLFLNGYTLNLDGIGFEFEAGKSADDFAQEVVGWLLPYLFSCETAEDGSITRSTVTDTLVTLRYPWFYEDWAEPECGGAPDHPLQIDFLVHDSGCHPIFICARYDLRFAIREMIEETDAADIDKLKSLRDAMLDLSKEIDRTIERLEGVER